MNKIELRKLNFRAWNTQIDEMVYDWVGRKANGSAFSVNELRGKTKEEYQWVPLPALHADFRIQSSQSKTS